MAGINGVVLVVFLISAMASGCYGAAAKRPFSALAQSLIVTGTPNTDSVLIAGVDKITVKWDLNTTGGFPTDNYKTVNAKLCYAPPSQVDRPWRKTIPDNLAKDKTCQFVIASKAFAPSNNSAEYTIKKDIPGALYFIRVYVYGADGHEVAYGQTSPDKIKNVFKVVGITGRTTSIDVASGVFSAFSVLSLGFFFYLEKKKASRTG